MCGKLLALLPAPTRSSVNRSDAVVAAVVVATAAAAVGTPAARPSSAPWRPSVVPSLWTGPSLWVSVESVSPTSVVLCL